MSYGLSRGKPLITEGSGITQAEIPHWDLARPETQWIDPRTWFSIPARPMEIEIGAGKGTFLIQQAQLKPEVNYLAFEWAGEFFRYAADRLRRRGLDNALLVHTDATEFIRYRLISSIIPVIHLYFSDPWPKSRHHKRRVVQDQSLREFHRVLEPGGELRLVTDHPDLWAWYEEHAARHADLFDRNPFEAPESAGDGELVGSNFERKYRVEGRPFHGMTLRKRT